jgi:PAS domain S-box-containing protein
LRKALNPLSQLVRDTRRIADGHYVLEERPSSYKEIDGLVGDFHRMAGIIRNREDTLRESEERYRTMMDQAADAIFMHDETGRILDVNRKACQSLGYSREELLSKSIGDLDPEAIQTGKHELWVKILAGDQLTFESHQIRKNGSSLPVEVTLGSVRLPLGQAVLGIVRDITDRKRAEKQIHRQSQLLTAINRIFLETLTTESEGEVAKTCLRVAQEITDSKFGFIGEITPKGLYTTTALSDPGWEACRIPETHANLLIKDMVIRGIWGQVILKDQSLIVNDPVSYPDRVGIPEGHPPLTSFLGVPLKDKDKVIGMIAMANRVSGYTADNQQDMETLSVAFMEAIRRKQAEEKIRQLNTELEQRVVDRTTQLEATNKELEAFSYSVSHDLRAPLRSIDGFSQALLEEYENKPLDNIGMTYLKRVRRATQRMGFLIDDMLKLSRVTQSEFHHESVALSCMVQAIAETHQKNNPDKSVDVTIQEGIMVQGDPYLMRIAMDNLLDNAWKFSGGKERPEIEFGAVIKDGKTIYFIKDNGAGFDMAYVGKLFGAFQRLHTTDDFPGTGIGLATVKRIINRHGGLVWAEGEVGKGATFYFTLPL